MAAKTPIQWTVAVDPSYTRDEREAIAQDIIDLIREKAKRGDGVVRASDGRVTRGRRFDSYSKEYAESLDFKIAGKSKSKIDLTLSGDMLGAIDIISSRKGEITVGYTDGSPEAARAEGNILGTYGQDKPIPGKSRDFLGLLPRELTTILERYTAEGRKVEAKINKAARDLVSDDEDDE